MSFKQKGLHLLFTILALVLFLAPPDFAIRNTQEVPKNGGTLHVKAFGDVFKPNLDPTSGSWIFITEQIFDGLVRLDYNLDIIPSLAEYWRPSGDGRIYTFYLRKGVRFHDGREMTSQDVKFSFERLIHKETNSPYYELLASKVEGAPEFREGKATEVSGFKAPDKYVFEIHWNNPYVSALSLLSMSFCKVVPRDLVMRHGNDFFWKPIGTGAFKFENWLRSPKLEIVGVRLERNGDYFGRKSYLDALEFSPYYTVNHFVDREIEMIPFVSDRLAASGGQVLQGGPYNVTCLMMSCRIPPLDRLPIRKALAYGIDKDRLVQALADGDSIRQPTYNYIPPRLPGFFPIYDAQNYDLEKAGRILEEQGFAPEKRFPELTLFLPSPRNDFNLKFSRELENQLDKLDIPLNIKYYKSLTELREFKKPFLANIRVMMDFPDAENIVRPLYYSATDNSGTWYGYDNPGLDKLFQEAEVERSRARRVELFRKMEKILGEDLPAIPLYSEERRIAVQPYVRGLKVPALGFDYVDAKDIWLVRKE